MTWQFRKLSRFFSFKQSCIKKNRHSFSVEFSTPWKILRKIYQKNKNKKYKIDCGSRLFFPHILKYKNFHTVVFNMLTNVGNVWVNENIKERRRKLCSFMLFTRILSALPDQWRKSLIIIFMFPEISLEFSFC